MLAGLSSTALQAAVGQLDEKAVSRLHRQLRAVHRRGFAVNNQETETGLTAIGVAVPTVAAGMLPAAVSVAMPTARYSRAALPTWAATTIAAAQGIAADLARSGSGPSYRYTDPDDRT